MINSLVLINPAGYLCATIVIAVAYTGWYE